MVFEKNTVIRADAVIGWLKEKESTWAVISYDASPCGEADCEPEARGVKTSKILSQNKRTDDDN